MGLYEIMCSSSLDMDPIAYLIHRFTSDSILQCEYWKVVE